MPNVPAAARSVADPMASATARVSKHDDRRDQLAESALVTLGKLGYAKTSLREIAQHSPFSHGVVHYYFSNKEELITYCVRYYKRTCVTRYDEIVATSTSAEELQSRFAAKLAETIREEGPMHQLWYDLRNQSMFEPALREVVLDIDGQLEQMIWRVMSRYAELAGHEARAGPVDDLRHARRPLRPVAAGLGDRPGGDARGRTVRAHRARRLAAAVAARLSVSPQIAAAGVARAPRTSASIDP